MKRTGKTVVWALSALTLTSGSRAVTPDAPADPYRGIVERNMFDIHPAPPPAPPAETKSALPPPPVIKLQGITDILGRKQVLFKTQLPSKPGVPVKEESFILTVGERQGDLEVIDINTKAGTVRMNVYGVLTNLSLEFNSDKLVNVAPASVPPPPSFPGLAPGTIAPPPSLPGSPASRFPRTLRLPGSAGAQNQDNSGSTGNNFPNGGGNFGGNFNGVNQNAQTANPLTADEQMVLIEAQRLKYESEGNPLSKIFPPTLINPTANLSPTPNPNPNPSDGNPLTRAFPPTPFNPSGNYNHSGPPPIP